MHPCSCIRHGIHIYAMHPSQVGQLRSNKPATLYEHPTRSYVVALTGSPDGRGILSAHLDGSVYRFFFDEQQAAQRIVQHPCVPYALAWGDAICCAGSDCKVCVCVCV